MTVPEVDVILPTWCGRDFAAEAIDSVLAQTHSAWHLTLVDDASPDDSFAWLSERYEDRADRITLLRLDVQKRAAGARMEAIARTGRELIAFIDQDDRWHPEKLALQVERLRQAPDFQAIHTDVQHIDANGNLLVGAADAENAARAGVDWNALDSATRVHSCFLRNRIRLASALVRRSSFLMAGGFDVSFFGGEDWDFWVRFAATGYRVTHIAEVLLERRVHQANVSRQHASERLRGALAAVDAAVERQPELEVLARRRRATLLRTDAIDQLRAGRGRATRDRLEELETQVPADIASKVLGLLSYLGPLAPPLLRLAERLRR
ncbi:MAG: glycosyltransferase [Myxococcales bacterium]|nr:glycosyltransferase [Myxococcales bacterium]